MSRFLILGGWEVAAIELAPPTGWVHPGAIRLQPVSLADDLQHLLYRAEMLPKGSPLSAKMRG